MAAAQRHELAATDGRLVRVLSVTATTLASPRSCSPKAVASAPTSSASLNRPVSTISGTGPVRGGGGGGGGGAVVAARSAAIVPRPASCRADAVAVLVPVDPADACAV